MASARRVPAALKWTAIVLGGIVLSLVLTIALLDWNALREPVARYVSEKTDRAVRIDGDLEVDLLTLTPQITVSGLKIGNPQWAGEGLMADVGYATAEIKLLPLLKGEVILPRLMIADSDLKLLADESGRANWQFGRAEPKPPAKEEPAELPAVQRFIVNDTRLQFIDRKRKLVFHGTVAADEKSTARNAQPFRLEGDGELNGRRFKLRVYGGPLINVDPDKPYTFQASITAGDTVLRAHGSVTEPFDLARYHAELSMSGDDLADLYYLTGLALPNTPPYKVSGRLERAGKLFYLTNAQGKVGDSDLRGDLTLDTSQDRPRLIANLKSESLDFDDLAAPLGAPPAINGDETVSETQKAIAAKLAEQRRLLPDAPLETERIRGMDAEVRYQADSVNARRVPFRRVSLHLKLDNGVLTADPLAFELLQGKVVGTARLDARKDVPTTKVDLRVSAVKLDQFKSRDAKQAPIEGVLQGRIQLTGTGGSVHAFASSADGLVTLVIPHGEVRAAFAELTGINVLRGLGLLLRDDQEQVDIRCGVADFRARDGMLSAKHIVFDTKDVLITGKGNVNLGQEEMDLSVRGQPKKLRLVRVRSPISISGRLRKPDIGLSSGNTAAQTGVAAVLATLVTPIAAVLAFVDPGLADDADCGALLAEAKKKGAPVKTATADEKKPDRS